jgi:UDP-N-acetylmuramoyl-tripeptide--D-alanyl-D-alanine ligase
MNVRTLKWVESTLSECGRLRGSELCGRDGDPWEGATIDSRGECAQRIFVAVKGEQADGHRFAAQARSKGSCAAIVESEETAHDLARVDAPHFLVDNSLAALQDLSRAYRRTLDLRVVAITGSAGKTTTKEYVRMILKTKYKVSSNPGNYNNHIGVPLTLLATDHDNEYLVSELGANHPGEIKFLADIIRPDIGVVTNIGDAHIGLFGSREAIADAKAELFAGMDAGGYAVIPREDDFYELLRERAKCRVVTFGYGDDCTYKLGTVRERGDRLEFTVNDEPLTIKSYGAYNVSNAGAAFSVGELCGVEVARIRSALANAAPVKGRARIYRTSELIVVDDSYNANPTSMRASVDGLARFPGRRHVAVLGDMAELGDYSESAHRELGEYLARAPVDLIHWLGPGGRFVEQGVHSIDANQHFRYHEALDDLITALEGELESGDVVLVKASRAAALERVVDRLVGVKENG